MGIQKAMWEHSEHSKEADQRRDSQAFLVCDNGAIKLSRKAWRVLTSLEECAKYETQSSFPFLLSLALNMKTLNISSSPFKEQHGD